MNRTGVALLVLFVLAGVVPPSCGGGGGSSGGGAIPAPGARPTATVTDPVGIQRGDITLAYMVSDAESDVLSILVQYSVDGGTTWSAATAGPGGDGTSGLASSLAGTGHLFVWASRIDLVALSGPVATVRIRITPSDAASGTAGTSANFSVNNSVTCYRITSLELRDPHLFANIITCLDATNSLAGQSVNELLASQITTDTAPSDGYYDLSLLLLFRPLDQAAAATGRMDLARGRCTVGTTTCDLDPAETPAVSTYTSSATGVLLAPIPGTTGSYVPAVVSPVNQGFSTGLMTFSFNLAGTLLPLTDVRLGAQYAGSPATLLTNGLIRGFLSETSANAIVVPLSTGPVALSSLLRGGAGCCSAGDDRDTHNATLGWWFYFNFTATEVTYVGP